MSVFSLALCWLDWSMMGGGIWWLLPSNWDLVSLLSVQLRCLGSFLGLVHHLVLESYACANMSPLVGGCGTLWWSNVVLGSTVTQLFLITDSYCNFMFILQYISEANIVVFTPFIYITWSLNAYELNSTYKIIKTNVLSATTTLKCLKSFCIII